MQTQIIEADKDPGGQRDKPPDAAPYVYMDTSKTGNCQVVREFSRKKKISPAGRTVDDGPPFALPFIDYTAKAAII